MNNENEFINEIVNEEIEATTEVSTKRKLGKKPILIVVGVVALVMAATLGVLAQNAKNEGSYMVRSEDGVTEYSTDEGETWESAPANGTIITEDGTELNVQTIDDGNSIMTIVGNAQSSDYSVGNAEGESGFSVISEDGSAISGAVAGDVLVKSEDGGHYYSTDGGETWTLIDGDEGAITMEDGSEFTFSFGTDEGSFSLESAE
ncbi:MAG: hypothetical protein LBQ95_07035 [Lachnospiraceae bacterium]|jgi:hypothetical protein|nr:hypothetical protein [Lachnospiraceae bacterium]